MEAEDGEAAVTLDALADDALQQIVAAYCCTVQSGDAALNNQKLPRVASRGREVQKSGQNPFRG